MRKETKQKLIENNKKFGLKTKFIIDDEILGYALKDTIYINEKAWENEQKRKASQETSKEEQPQETPEIQSNQEEEQFYEKINMHEILHYYTEDQEFQEMKKKILEQKSSEIDKIRQEYELKYYGIYSEEEIKAGAIDEEIAINIIIEEMFNEISINAPTIQIGENFLSQKKQEQESAKYLNLSIRSNTKNMGLTKWEQLFYENYYDGKTHQRPQEKKDEKKRKIREDIKKSLQELYDKQKEDFEIDPHSPEIIREFEAELEQMEKRGENKDEYIKNKENKLQYLAKTYSEHLWEEYSDIVEIIKKEPYEPAFKYLMLNETLTKTYRKEKQKGKTATLIKKREPHKSISNHMTLNKETLDIMYKNIETNENFAEMYFGALETLSKASITKNEINLKNIETYGKGKWLKFNGRGTDPEGYLEEAKRLAALVKDTPWCTKSLAVTHLAEGDFYVFVDNEGNPHVAVKTKMSEIDEETIIQQKNDEERQNTQEIDEVRGIQNGYGQELEEEYRDVALSFLENNQEIKNGKEWFEKEEWNQRLIDYNTEIEEGTFEKDEVPSLLRDLFIVKDYKKHNCENSNKHKLRTNLRKVENQIAEYYGIKKEEICFGDLYLIGYQVGECPYKIVLGNLEGQYYGGRDLCKIQFVGGDIKLQSSNIADLKDLQYICGKADFENTSVLSLGKLKYVGGTANFCRSHVRSTRDLEYVGGNAYFNHSDIFSTGKIANVGGYVDLSGSLVGSTPNLETVGGAVRINRASSIRDLGKLWSIGEEPDWEGHEKLLEQYRSNQEEKKKEVEDQKESDQLEDLKKIAKEQKESEFLKFVQKMTEPDLFQTR